MEIHFHEKALLKPTALSDNTTLVTWRATEVAIQELWPVIHTTQMGLLSTRLFDLGYRIFVHPTTHTMYEINLGENTCTDREIHSGHDLFRLWQNGEFG